MLFDVMWVKHFTELIHYLESHYAFILTHWIHVVLYIVIQDGSLFKTINQCVLQ